MSPGTIKSALYCYATKSNIYTEKSLCRHLTSNERTSMEDEDLDLWAELNNGLHSFVCQAGTAAHVHLLYNVKNRCEYSVKNRCEQCLTMAFIPSYAIWLHMSLSSTTMSVTGVNSAQRL